MAIDFNVPSQVRPYANLGAFPATGAVKTIYIAEDTNKTYRWTGSAYVEISASPTQTSDLTNDGENGTNPFITALDIPASLPPSGTAGGDLTSTYPNPTVHRIHGIDMQNGTPSADETWVYGGSPAKWQHQHLNASQVNNDSSVTGANVKLALNHLDSTKVPTTRTLTINGTTQDLSADRTFTISTGITIGTTAITSGTVGRVLFEGTGNVVQESGNLFWDNTNGRLGIGTSSPIQKLDVVGTARFTNATINGTNGTITIDQAAGGNYLYSLNSASSAWRDFTIQTNGVDVLNVLSTGRVTLGTKTSATNTLLTLNSGGLNAIESSGNISFKTCNTFFVEGTNRLVIGSSGVQNEIASVAPNASGWKNLAFQTNGTTATLFTTGNFAINTTTDAGFKLDVNGTARLNNSVVAQTISSVNLLDVSNVRIADDANGRYIQSVNGITLRATGTPTTNFITLSSNLANSWKSTQTILISPSAGGGGALFSSSAIAGPSNTILTFTRQRNDSAKSAIINSEDFASSGNLPINMLIYAGKETVLNNQANLILCHDGTTTRGNTLIGTTTNVASAIVNVESTTQGFLCPRMTTTQKNAIASPAAGLMVYDTTLNLMALYNGTTWTTL